jgi:hypothetical protein
VCVAIIEDIDYGVAWVNTTNGSEFIAGRTDMILRDILDERIRQDEKWGHQRHNFAFWMSILGEEVGEAFKALNDNVLFPIAKENERIEVGKPVKWGKSDPADYGTPTTVPYGDPNVKSMEQLFAEARKERTFRDRDKD